MGFLRKLLKKLKKGKSDGEEFINDEPTPMVKPKKIKKRKRNSITSGPSVDEILSDFFSHKSRPFIHGLFRIAFFLTISWGIAKLLTIVAKPLPKNIKGAKTQFQFDSVSIAKDTKDINDRNLFNSERSAPKVAKKKKLKKKMTGPCIAASKKTTLPVDLVNTIVLQNDYKSIAAIKMRGQKKSQNVRQGDTIPRIGKVGLIKQNELFFRNTKSGQCESVAMKTKKEFKTQLSVLSAKRGKKILEEIDAEKSITNAGNEYQIDRSYLNKQIENLSAILSQAKATPIKNPDGSLSFKITDVVPGSVYTTLGIQDNDYISQINGRPIKNPGEVMSLFRRIKSVKNLNLTIKRNGTEQVLNYKFNDK